MTGTSPESTIFGAFADSEALQEIYASCLEGKKTTR